MPPSADSSRGPAGTSGTTRPSADPAPSVDELIRDVRASRPGAWERLVRQYGPLVAAVPRRLGLGESDVEEVFQATWLALYRYLPRLRQPSAAASWIRTTATRESVKLIRLRQRRSDVERTAPAPTEVGAAADEVLGRLERAEVVRTAIERLGDPCQRLLSALYLEPEASYAEVAARLGVPIGSIGPTRMRCLAKLATRLEGRLDP